MLLTPLRAPGKVTIWRCDYCGQRGVFEAMQASECPHVYPPCEHCGGSENSNECKPDCPGIAAILARPDVYVAGTGEKN